MIKKTSPIIYLAGPYTHDNKAIEQIRFERLTFVSAVLVRDGIVNFSPITQSHEQHLMTDLPTDWAFWQHFDEQFLCVCDELWVFCMPGWQESIGVTAEIEGMRSLGKPVKFIQYDPVHDKIEFLTEQEARGVTL